jgi:diguanylate cyclase (GGDEF)-like protein
MGMIVFYIFVAGYAVVSGLGVLRRALPVYIDYVLCVVLALYFAYYMFTRKRQLVHTIVAAVLTNAAVQLTGSIVSPLFPAYFAALLVICSKEKLTLYWVVAVAMFVCEALSSVVGHQLSVIPLAIWAAAIVVVGFVKQTYLETEQYLKKSLAKYESRDDFFRPAELDNQQITTSVAEIDRHPPSERPLLYLVRLIHDTFGAYSTAIFSYYNESLTLIQGFSQSEMFRSDAVVDVQSGIYKQVIASGKPLLIAEFSQNPEELGYYHGEVNVASVLITPIMILGECQGALVIDRKEKAFTEDDRLLFAEAANSVALILALLRRYEEKHDEAQHLKYVFDHVQELQRVLDMQQIFTEAQHTFTRMMQCDDVSIASVDDLNEEGEVVHSTYIREHEKFSYKDGLVGMIARHKNYIIREDLGHRDLVVLKRGVTTHNRSFIGLPVMRDDDILGVVWLEDHRKGKFTKDHVESLKILTSQLSFAWQRALLHEQVKEMSERDGLTGLFNHRKFQETLQAEIDKKKEVVLLLLDIDHFKKVNDTYGHQAGDKVLEFLGRHISQTGFAARYGGEEFAIVLPRYSLKQGLDRAMRIVSHFRNSAVKINAHKVRITVSIGVAHFPGDAQTREKLIEQADKALYHAKDAGRDQVTPARLLAAKHGHKEEQ